MYTFVAKRLAIAVLTLLILIIFSFILMFAAPGGPFSGERPPPVAVLANIEARYGLDQPYAVQVFNYVKTLCCILISARRSNIVTAR